jgi:hypothetical protein
LKLSGYLHDVGKPLKCFMDEGGQVVHFKGHAQAGARVLKDELRGLRFSNEEIVKICTLTEIHMNNYNQAADKTIRQAVKKWRAGGVEVADYIRLRIADRAANLGTTPYTPTGIKEQYLNKFAAALKGQVPLEVQDLALRGGEIAALFHLKPGPIIGRVQRELLERVLEEPSLNDKEKLTAAAGRILASLQK